MRKPLISVIFIGIYLIFNIGCWSKQNDEFLQTLAGRYIDFLKMVGQSDIKTYEAQVPNLFAPHFKKVMNGKIALTTSKELAPHLKDVRLMAGTWTVDNLETLSFPQDRVCVVRYVLNSSKEGTYTTIAILRYDDKELITEVNEVHNKFER